MEKWLKDKKSALYILVVVCVLGTALYNGFTNDAFWEISISSVLTLLVALVFSYYFTQLKEQDRAINKKIESILYKIQDMINQPDFIKSDDEAIQRRNLMKYRSIANKIS